MVLSGLRYVVALRPPPRWRPSPCLGGGEIMLRGNSHPRSSWATAAVSTNVVPFLKALVRVLTAPINAPGENPRSSDRMAATLLCRALLEDAILNPTTGGQGLRFVLHSSCALLGFSSAAALGWDQLA
jgi:hypothetical protein